MPLPNNCWKLAGTRSYISYCSNLYTKKYYTQISAEKRVKNLEFEFKLKKTSTFEIQKLILYKLSEG